MLIFRPVQSLIDSLFPEKYTPRYNGGEKFSKGNEKYFLKKNVDPSKAVKKKRKEKFGCDQKVPKKISKPSHVAINYFFSINKNY